MTGFRRGFAALLVGLAMFSGVGCPGTGHLRPEPDWTKQGEGPTRDDSQTGADENTDQIESPGNEVSDGQ